MALVRCETHGRPRGRKQKYVKYVRPVGWPKSAAICGSKGCEEVGLIWLTDAENQDYDTGQRVFDLKTATMKVRAN